jgi:hypothetical protein
VATELPPCGVYRTVKPVGNIEANRLVYFHNHGNPGPGLYFPEKWNANKAVFSANGQTVPDDFDPKSIKPLPAEGFYRVTRAFHCCEKKCTQFEPEALLQLGYNGNGRGILFVPEYAGGVIRVPERGSLIDDDAFKSLVALKLPEVEQKHDLSLPRGFVIH